MNVFELRKRVIDDYRAYVKSFISIADQRIREHVDKELDDNELLWPQARIGLNPAFAEGAWIDRPGDVSRARHRPVRPPLRGHG